MIHTRIRRERWLQRMAYTRRFRRAPACVVGRAAPNRWERRAITLDAFRPVYEVMRRRLRKGIKP
ncbi:MAG: hypothetical protein EOO54_03715 [Haliea sp.]|nr:MAG: hypothetical protein EOO54_03715 [Haliea sp.]